MALVNKNDVKSYINYSKDGNDGVISDLIDRVEEDLKKDLNDVAFDASGSYTTYTEYYDGQNSYKLFLPKYPIRAITSIHIDSDRTFDAATQVDSDNIITSKLGHGIVTLDGQIFVKGHGNVKIVYTAGWKADDAPTAFKQIIINRVVALLLEGVGGVNVVEESDFVYRPAKLRAQADELFKPYKRFF